MATYASSMGRGLPKEALPTLRLMAKKCESSILRPGASLFTRLHYQGGDYSEIQTAVLLTSALDTVTQRERHWWHLWFTHTLAFFH